MAANFDNQKPQPPKYHHHTTTTTTKIKIIERERSVGRRSVGRRRDRAEARLSSAVLQSTRPVRSGACDRQIGACKIERRGAIGAVLRSTRPVRLVRAIVGLELGVHRRSSDWTGARGSPSSSSRSLSLSVRNSFEVKIGTKMNFHGQRVFFTVN